MSCEFLSYDDFLNKLPTTLSTMWKQKFADFNYILHLNSSFYKQRVHIQKFCDENFIGRYFYNDLGVIALDNKDDALIFKLWIGALNENN